jgi:outer membrane immunogenic protein
MHIRIKTRFIFLFLAATAVFTAVSASAQTSAPAEPQPHPELAVVYNYVRSNAPPGGCGCINLNGGSASFAWPFKAGHLSLVGDIGAVHGGSSSSEIGDLTLSSYTGGLRYSPRKYARRLQPWGQLLIGGSHASGSAVEDSGSWAFAALAGGGLDARATRHFSLRIIEADYLATTFTNGINDHQNNLRLAAGLVFRF